MERKYCDFIDEITARDLYERLLGYGMFANKLPPIFTNEPFLQYCLTFSPVFDKDWHDYVSYSSMRNINIPRLFGIPTPMKYQRLCAILRDNWDVVKAHFHAQTDHQGYRVSRIHLRKMFDRKELFEMNYKNWREDGNPETGLLFLASDISVSKYIVKADISTCFPSIYSHSLCWAFVGKDEAKKHCNDSTLWYNMIDAACYTLKNGETHGLLIGPHASNLLSEVILTVVDKKLYDQGYRFYRNIDDYECFVETFEKAQRFLRDLGDALREFDLALNHKKTAISTLPVALAEKWIHKLNNNLTIAKDQIHYNEVNAYLDLALGLANDTGDSAVLNYAIKSLLGKEMTAGAKKLAAQRIMHMAVVFPYLIQMMEDFVFAPMEVERTQIKQFADAVYVDSVKSHNFEGVCYAIYYSLKHDFPLNDLDIDWVIKCGDCVMLLMTWLYYLKANHGNRRATQLKPLRQAAMNLKDANFDRQWLFCYEVLPQAELKGDWKMLKKAGVSFVRDRY